MVPAPPPFDEDEPTRPEQDPHRRGLVDRLVEAAGGDGTMPAAREQRNPVGRAGTPMLPAELPAFRASAAKPCLLVLAGPRLGELLPVDGELVIGRDPGADLQILDEGISRRHARIRVQGDRVHLTDLDSANGTWVDGVRIDTPHALADGDRFRVGRTTVVKLTWQDALGLRHQRQQLEAALRDGLTSAFNARYFRERLDAEIFHAARHALPLSVLACGVDRFDLVNRVHGRPAGDQMLKGLADVMYGTIRPDDVLGRIEGDTFGLIARDTGIDGGLRLAERLRGVIADARFEARGQVVELRVSVGVSGLAPGGQRSGADLFDAAREALQQAKRLGRNRVALDEDAGRRQD